jgi:hypothetical protein
MKKKNDTLGHSLLAGQALLDFERQMASMALGISYV